METPLSNRLIELLPAIKGRWEALLKTELKSGPSTGGGVTAGMLVLMLGTTLARLPVRVTTFNPCAAATLPPNSRRKKQSDNCCRCGLDLLMNYYMAGARAPRDVLPRDLGEDRVLVSHCLSRLAHEEIEGLASVCNFNGRECCALFFAELPAANEKSPDP